MKNDRKITAEKHLKHATVRMNQTDNKTDFVFWQNSVGFWRDQLCDATKPDTVLSREVGPFSRPII